MLDEEITLSRKEVDRLAVARQLGERILTQADAARQLGVSVRQVKRILRRYRAQGPAGVVSGHRGRAATNRVDDETRRRAIELLKIRYEGFGPVLAHEKLTEQHDLACSRETLRKWMLEEQLWTPRRRGPRRVHPPRPRRPRRGELVQIDGSPHAWFEDRGPYCTLIVFIDDATGELMALRFAPTETTEAYMTSLRAYLREHGRPIALYSDRHSIFRDNNSEDTPELTQFGRALQTLQIEAIHASTPQAKGRVERVNQTLQDRLVKELRLHGIDKMDEANAFLEDYRAEFNARFRREPLDPLDAHRIVLHDDREIELILGHQELRTVSKDLVVRFQKTRCRIEPTRGARRLGGTKIVACRLLDDSVALIANGRELTYQILEHDERPPPLADEKTVGAQVDAAVEKANTRSAKPAPDHPWRRPVVSHPRAEV